MRKLLFLLLLLTSCAIQTPSKGQKTGVIVRLSECGVLCKTYEGDLIRGGLSDGSGVIGQSFHFTIEKSTLYDEALKLFEDQSEVVIEYEKPFITAAWRSESNEPAFITSIRKVKK